MAGQQRALSFGGAADAYDRARPRPLPAALDWLVPLDCQAALDLAAGTGLFTRRLLGRVGRVVAVEPDPRMRAVLSGRSPDVEVLAGTAEAIPLPDGSVDAVFVSSAWHWMDPQRALPQIARVLRPGGRLGVIWTGRDSSVEWVGRLGRVLSAAPPSPGRVRHRLELPAGSGFAEPEHEVFRGSVEMPVEAVVEQLSTYSGLITAAATDRAAALERARALLTELFPAGLAVLPVASSCWRTERG
jgi:SAM-dependent methyltransferase